LAPTVSRRRSREFGGIINSSALTATLDVGFARRDAAAVDLAAVSTLPRSLLTACFSVENARDDQKKSIDS
jgi:hypothetical protein